MKIEPLNYVLDNGAFSSKNFYIISGNETTLIEKTKEKIIGNYKLSIGGTIENIKNFDEDYKNSNLFSSKKLIIVNNPSEINDKKINELIDDDLSYLFVAENSPKNNRIKKSFFKRDDSYLFDCYELDRGNKINAINFILSKKNLKLSDDIYWYLVENLDARYSFFIDDLNKLMNINEKSISLESAEKLLTKNSNNVEKIFFDIFKKNSQLIKIYNEKITNDQMLRSFIASFKRYTDIIIESEDEKEFAQNIPKYLFREKSLFVTIFRKVNRNKVKELINHIFITETHIRKNKSIDIIFGLRFLLKYKKILIS